MYYRKNRSILTSIRNNKNNKVYYILVVVMLAAICLIAASIILRGYNNSNGDNIAEETTLVADRTEQQGTSAAGDILDTIAGYKVYIFVDDGAIAYCTFNQDGELIDIAGAARCNIGSGVSKYLNNMNRVVLKETMSASTKMLWKELTYNEEEYYVQYYSLINGIEFHSALYTENNNYNSIVKESYESIKKYERDNNSNIKGGDENAGNAGGNVGNAGINAESDDINGGSAGINAGIDSIIDEYSDCSGITLSVASAREIYENVPSTAEVIICKSYQDSELYNQQFLNGKSYDDLYTVINSTMDSKYFIAGSLPEIPDGYGCDPTDNEANYVFSPYKLGAIDNVSDKTAEFGQVAYSLLDSETGSTLIKVIFNDVKLTDESGEDIGKYLMERVDLSAYKEAQIAGMNINGFLLPGDYLVKFYSADVYGTYLEKRCYLHVMDTTPPVIELNREITEINQAQIENPDYIKGMVTVTDLCKLADGSLTYELSEENGRVRIRFSASDVYGNIGMLELNGLAYFRSIEARIIPGLKYPGYLYAAR